MSPELERLLQALYELTDNVIGANSTYGYKPLSFPRDFVQNILLAACFMGWLRFLTDVGLLITVGVDAIVLCHVFPAFRRTKNRAFLFIAIACVLGIIDSVYDHTVTLQGLRDR